MMKSGTWPIRLMMAGDIRVESEPGRGSTFIFTAEFGLASREIEKRSQQTGALKGLRILVVDDSTTSQSIFKEALESFSFKVAVAESGAKAIAEELRSGPDTYGNVSDINHRLAEDFDLDGILKFCDTLEAQAQE